MNGFSNTLNVPRGNTRDPEYRRLTLLYEFNKLTKWMPRDISPTDIDGRFLIHSLYRKRDSFLFLELKTIGAKIRRGQQMAIDGMCRLGKGLTCFILATHPSLEKVEVPPDIFCFRLRMWDAQAKAVIETSDISNDAEEQLGWWVQQWFRHAEEQPNTFVTEFRKLTGIYKFRKGKCSSNT